MNKVKGLILQRAVAYGVVQNYDAAISDLTAYLQIDSTSYLGYWQRAVCQYMMNDFNASQGINTKLMAARTMLDFNRAIDLNPKNAYMYFDRGNLYARQKEYGKAIDDFTSAINLDLNLAEAYYNRGLARIYSNNKIDGINDLSKAGELGLYNAYSVIKRYSK